MKLIFIYGPPASGKLTIAKELSRLSSFAVFDNHAVIDLLTPLFPFGDKQLTAVRQELQTKIRLGIIEQAATHDVSCITTFGSQGEPYFDYYRSINKTVTTHDGEVCFVQLSPTIESMKERVASIDRKSSKMGSIDALQVWLHSNTNIYAKFPDVEHLTIDNSSLSATEAAKTIVDYYKL